MLHGSPISVQVNVPFLLTSSRIEPQRVGVEAGGFRGREGELKAKTSLAAGMLPAPQLLGTHSQVGSPPERLKTPHRKGTGPRDLSFSQPTVSPPLSCTLAPKLRACLPSTSWSVIFREPPNLIRPKPAHPPLHNNFTFSPITNASPLSIFLRS